MKDAKKKWQMIILSVLLGGLALSLYFAWGSGKESKANSNPSPQPAAPLSSFKEGVLYFDRGLILHGRKKEIPISQLDPTLHVEKLSNFNAGSPSSSRNMFSLSAAAVPEALTKKAAPTAASVPPGNNQQAVPSSGRPASPPPVVINLKYIGFKQEGLPTKRQGFFSEGGTLFLAGEGELIANRYRVIKIQENSAEIEDIPSKSRRQLNLAAP